MLIPFYAFRIMAGAGAAIMLLAFWGLWLALRGKMTPQNDRPNKWFLRATIFAASCRISRSGPAGGRARSAASLGWSTA